MTPPLNKEPNSFKIGLAIGVIAFSIMTLSLGGLYVSLGVVAPLCGGIVGTVTILPVIGLIFIVLAVVQVVQDVARSVKNSQTIANEETQESPPEAKPRHNYWTMMQAEVNIFNGHPANAKPRHNYWMMMQGTLCSYFGVTLAYGLLMFLFATMYNQVWR